jgi:hypothetical protein
MEALRSYDTSVLTRATRRNTPEDDIFHLYIHLRPIQSLRNKFSLSAKRSAREADCSPPTSAEDKKTRINTSAPLYDIGVVLTYLNTEAIYLLLNIFPVKQQTS